MKRQQEPGGRHIVVRVRVSQEEKDQLVAEAKRQNSSVSKVLIDGVFGTPNRLSAEFIHNELYGVRRVLNAAAQKYDPAFDLTSWNQRIDRVLDGLEP